jgi:ferredoxin
MRVIVNRDLCEGNALCMEIAPEVFVVEEDDKTRLLVERPGEALRAKVAEAVRRCPRQALAIEEE